MQDFFIEGMIAIAITGILASIAIPNYIKYENKARMIVARAQLMPVLANTNNFSKDNTLSVNKCLLAFSKGSWNGCFFLDKRSLLFIELEC